MKTIQIFIVLASFLLNSCSKSSTQDIQENNGENLHGWTVPLNEIVGDFSPFPFAENPKMVSIDKVEGINDESRVIAISFNERVNIYPLTFVHPFETVNDTLFHNSFTVSYCPITQSTYVINRDFLNQKLTFRASGILYKENLVMHDNASDSFWSQMLLKNIKGPFQNETLSIFPVIETSWKTAKTYFPNAQVFTNKSITSAKISKLSKPTENIGNDEKVFGVIDNIKAKEPSVFIFRYSQFNDGIKIISTGLANKKIMIGSNDLKFITSLLNENNNTFTPVQNEFPIIMADELGNKWNVFGKAVSGPNKGNSLKPAIGFVASWWAWKSFYNDFIFNE